MLGGACNYMLRPVNFVLRKALGHFIDFISKPATFETATRTLMWIRADFCRVVRKLHTGLGKQRAPSSEQLVLEDCFPQLVEIL